MICAKTREGMSASLATLHVCLSLLAFDPQNARAVDLHAEPGTHTLAITAIAPVSGALWSGPPKFKPPASLCYITGTVDPLNPIEGAVPKLATGGRVGVRAKPEPPVRDSILEWAQALGCPAETASTVDANGVRTETYSPCLDASEVVYIAVDGLGHTRAGGRSLLPETMVGKTSSKISATDVIREFFRKHPRSPGDENAARQGAPANADKAHR